MKKINKTWIGIIFGIVGPFIGFSLYYFVHFTNYTFERYVITFLDKSDIQAPILAMSIIFNALLFFGSNKLKTLNLSRGILLGTILYVPIMIYLKFIR